MTATLELPVDRIHCDDQVAHVDGAKQADRQMTPDTHLAGAVGPNSRDSHPGHDTQKCLAVTGTSKPAAIPPPSPIVDAPLADPFLALAADVLDDVERTKIANQNRLRQLTRTEPDEDGEMRGFGLDESHPDVARLAALVDMLANVEHDATLNLRRIMRKHALGPWCKAQPGIGEKQGARLLAAIGDPYMNMATGQPRTVSQLWAYSGLHVIVPTDQSSSDTPGSRVGGEQAGDPGLSTPDIQTTCAGVAARRRKGVRSNWSDTAKMRAYLVAVSCMKTPGSPYRDVYLARREHTSVTHPDWTPGHSHNDALRITAKRVLRELWREARRLHGVTDTPNP